MADIKGDLVPARRGVLKLAGAGTAGAVAAVMAAGAPRARAQAGGGAGAAPGGMFEVTAYGATGNGTTLDTPAVNRAIEAAAAAGGGTVYFRAGQYLCYSIHLKSNVGLHLGPGAVIVAADFKAGQSGPGYDPPGPAQAWEAYQDFGHNHWQNSLIWGEGLENISILGPGRIYGKGLSRANNARSPIGEGNKSISLKNCHNVLLKDFQILQAGWFGILATGVDNFTIDGLTIDTNRDGMDIDSCRNVRVSNCAVNSPWDDAIVPKSSYALGYARPTINLEISNCYVTGAYQLGTMLDGTWKEFEPGGPRVGHTGRIKMGTESNGGFQNITITNCVFEGCQGLALESEDGALLEDVTISNLTMRGIISAPIFMRLGSRLRGPAGTTHTGAMRRVKISNVVCSDSASYLGCVISGVPGHPIENVTLSDIYIQHRGGGTAADAAITPPEDESKYPEPGMFGRMPSQGFYIRHVNNIELSGIQIEAMAPDARPGIVLQNAENVDLFHVKTPANVPAVVLHDSKNVTARWVRGVQDGAVS